MKPIKIKPSSDSSPVSIGKNIWTKAVARLVASSRCQSVVIFYDPAVKREIARLRGLRGTRIPRSIPLHMIEVPARESSKSLKHFGTLCDQLIRLGCDRKSLFIAAGGGVITDLVGFVASTYMRGVPWISVPTTLLGQVDSGMGGKTAINSTRAKNLIGTFCPPIATLSDTGFLRTLPRREILSGLGETLKYGLIFERKMALEIIANWKKLLQNRDQRLQKVIVRSAQHKMRVVSQDARDTRGLRELLNFGHSIGHALEAATQYRTFRHGEAILWGMLGESFLSFHRGLLRISDFELILDFAKTLSLPPIPSSCSNRRLLEALSKDKKNQSGVFRFVLLSQIGKAHSGIPITTQEAVLAFDFLRSAQ